LGRTQALFVISLFVASVASAPALAQSCTVTNASGSYGNVDVLSGAANDSTSTFTVTCTGKKNNTVRLCLEMSAGSPTDAGKRALSNGSKFLDHEFYSDASRTQLWGSWGSVVTAYGTGGVTYDLTLNSSGNGNNTFTVYARVLASQQTASPLSYTWSATSPGLRYAYAGSAACPTGGSTATGGTTLWTATVPANCLVSTVGVNFGSSGAITANVDATGSAAVQCTNTTPYVAALNGGNSGATDPTQRKMSKASETITYGLYRDVARSLPWGSTAGTNTVSGTGSGSSQALTVYGRVAAQTTPSPGTYTDSVILTLTY
jgi:spore coat protein U domain-containing protein, fimbrial subunit CupE1/2/3/6